MPSNSRNLSSLLGTDTKIATDDISGVAIGIGFYANEAALPTDGNLLGAKAYAESEGTLHFWNGASWGALAATEYEVPASWVFQGSVSGYTSGGDTSPGRVNTINKFPFASDGNATDVGDLTAARASGEGQSSDVSGYTSGGTTNFNTPGHLNTIDKFPFAADANATDVGDLTQVRYGTAGQSSSTSGYTAGGSVQPSPEVNTIDKFPFAADANATDVGDLSQTRWGGAGQSSSTSGYTSGGRSTGYPGRDTIDKFPFAADANATDVGDLTQTRYSGGGNSSDVSGYIAGGNPGTLNKIEKFPFATDANATDVGDLTVGREDKPAGQSSTASGYTSGGLTSVAFSDVIDKFPFASDANATDVGDLTGGLRLTTGQQV